MSFEVHPPRLRRKLPDRAVRSHVSSMVFVLMGVSGSGKTTIGRRLADELGWRFVDADDLHPPANVARMRAGRPLRREDREPWVAALEERVRCWVANGENVVLAFSGLERGYRDRLNVDPRAVRWAWLDAPDATLTRRLAERRGHFMPPSLVPSQRATLEPPEGIPRIATGGSVEDVLAVLRRLLPAG